LHLCRTRFRRPQFPQGRGSRWDLDSPACAPFRRDSSVRRRPIAGEGAAVFALARPDAATALAALEDGAAVDVLVTDLAMPGQDGRSLIGAARRLRPGLPCLLLTGQPEDQEAALPPCPGKGPCTVLHKPVSGPRFTAALVGLRTAR
jgi:CheY-like chemotaxis protein